MVSSQLLLLVVMGQLFSRGNSGFINMSVYKNFPPLYKFDDYDECLVRDAANTETLSYCVVYAEIVPNDSEPLWHEIKKFSNDTKRHYRHDRLFFGVCLERCRNVSKILNPLQYSSIFEDIEDEELKSYYLDVYKSDADHRSPDRKNLKDSLSNCLNRDFMMTFNLSLRIFIEYCDGNDRNFIWDIWYTIFIAVVGIITAFVIISSIVDLKLKKNHSRSQQQQDDDDEFYKVRLNNTPHILLTAFSISRNYYRLNRDPSRKTEEQLQFLDGIRTLAIFCVIMAHVVVVFMVIQIENPEFFEKYYYRIESSIFENGTVILQMFFFMSGFLLYINFKERQVLNEKSGWIDCLKTYFQLLTLRFLRLMPSIALLLLFTASFLKDMQDGPFWRHITEAERQFCREYWWKSLLLFNNISDMRKNCLHHVWYIATDLQLFGVFLIVIIITTRFPKMKERIFCVVLILAALVPALVTYFQNFDAFFITNPETYRYLYFKDTPTLYGSYLPFYTNLSGYLFGCWTADVYLRLRARKLSIDFLKLNLLWALIFPLAFALLFSGYWFMSKDFEKPSAWEALYAGVFRNIWSLMTGALALGLCFRIGWIANDFLRLGFFRLFARISYQSYLWHTIVIRILMGHFRAPVHIDHLFVSSNVVSSVILTYVVSYFVALFWEYPLAEIVRCISTVKRGKANTDQDTGEVYGLRDQNVQRY